MPLIALLLDPDSDRRSATAARLRALGHIVLHQHSARLPPDVVLGPRQTDLGAPLLGSDDPDLDVRLAELERQAPPRLLTLSDRQVDLRNRRVVRADGTTPLTETEVSLLAWMASRPHEVVTREQLLVDVWGYRPDLRTRTVDTTMARLRAKIETDPSAPVHLETIRGEGYRFTPAEQAAPSVPPVASPQAPPLLGRGAELFELRELLEAAPGVVTVIGGPGIGKTTLVEQLTESVFIELASCRSRTDVLAAVSGTLGVRPDGIAQALHRPVSLDNAEQVLAPLAELLTEWLSAQPAARIAVTSRVRLGVPGERLLELGPLPADAATTLLLTRARERRAGFASSERDQVHVEALVAILGGVPLALELAAARARVLSPRDLADRLRRDLGTLRDPSRPERHATVEGACRWSWELLTEAQRLALSTLAVFRGGFHADASDAVGVELEDLEALIDHSLVRLVGSPDGRLRFDVLEVIRSFARDQDSGTDAEEAHAAWLLDRARAMQDDARESFEGVRALGRERANATAACRRLLEGQPDRAARILLAHQPRWELHHTPPDHHELLESLWSAVGAPGLRARVGYSLALAAFEAGQHDRSLAVTLEATEAAREGSDADTLTRLVGMHSVLLASAKEPERALALLQTAPADQAGPAARCDLLLTRAALARRRGDPAAAEDDLREAIAIAQKHRLGPYVVSLEGHLVVSVGIQGRHDEAIELNRRLLAVHRDQGNPNHLARLALNQANMLSMRGRPDEALALIDEVSAMVHDLDQPALTVALGRQLAQALWLTAQFTEALAEADRAARLARAHSFAGEAMICHALRSTALLELDRPEDALRAARSAQELLEGVAIRRFQADQVAGDALWSLGRREEARQAWSAALAHDHDGDRADVSGLHARLALAAVALGESGQAHAERALARLEDRAPQDPSRGARAWLALAVVQRAAGQDPAPAMRESTARAERSGAASAQAAVDQVEARLAQRPAAEAHRWAEVVRVEQALDGADSTAATRSRTG